MQDRDREHLKTEENVKRMEATSLRHWAKNVQLEFSVEYERLADVLEHVANCFQAYLQETQMPEPIGKIDFGADPPGSLMRARADGIAGHYSWLAGYVGEDAQHAFKSVASRIYNALH